MTQSYVVFCCEAAVASPLPFAPPCSQRSAPAALAPLERLCERMMLPPTAQPSSADGQEDSEKIFLLVAELTNPEQRESALLELSKRRETFVDLAPILWHSFGTISALLQEIVAIYPLLSPPSLTAQASNRVCNALALLQCVASHPETRTLFLNGATPPIPHSRVCARVCGPVSQASLPPA